MYPSPLLLLLNIYSTVHLNLFQFNRGYCSYNNNVCKTYPKLCRKTFAVDFAEQKIYFLFGYMFLSSVFICKWNSFHKMTAWEPWQYMRMPENFENHIFSQHFDGLFLIYIRFIIHKYDDKISLRLKIAKL